MLPTPMLKHNHGRFSRPDRGFTLVELLVVIAIVGILMSLVLPTMKDARYKAREIQCSSNLKFQILGTTSYSHDYKGAAPDGGYSSYGRTCVDPDTRKVLFDNYGLGFVKMWFCPLAYLVNDSTVTTSFRLAQNPRWFSDPSYAPSGLNWTQNHRASTGYLYFLGPSRGFGESVANQKYNMSIYTKFDSIRRPSTRQVWTDNTKTPGATAGGVSGGWQHPCNTHDREKDGYPEGTMNAMADGHVEFRKYYWGVNVDQWVFQYFVY